MISSHSVLCDMDFISGGDLAYYLNTPQYPLKDILLNVFLAHPVTICLRDIIGCYYILIVSVS